MKHELEQVVSSVVQSPKTAAAVTTATTAVGLSTFLNFVPGLMGLVTMAIGISLQLILRRKGKLESERIRLQSEKLELEIKILKRKEAGDPCRKEDDQID